ncbi:MAG: glycoside hydrolase family 16 protein, partial [Cyclobacteriaceae bacterium]
MKYIISFSLIFCSALALSQGNLVWSDEFDYEGGPDPKKWAYDLGDGCPNVCGWGNDEEEYYTNHPMNVRVEGGILTVEAHYHPDSPVP